VNIIVLFALLVKSVQLHFLDQQVRLHGKGDVYSELLWKPMYKTLSDLTNSSKLSSLREDNASIKSVLRLN